MKVPSGKVASFSDSAVAETACKNYLQVAINTPPGAGRVAVTAQVGVRLQKESSGAEVLQAYLTDVSTTSCPNFDSGDGYAYGYFYQNSGSPAGFHFQNGMVQRIFDFNNGSSSVTRRYYLNFRGSDNSVGDTVNFWSASLHAHYTPIP